MLELDRENTELLDKCNALLQHSKLPHGEVYLNKAEEGIYTLEVDDSTGIRLIIMIRTDCPQDLLSQLKKDIQWALETRTGKFNLKKFIAFI